MSSIPSWQKIVTRKLEIQTAAINPYLVPDTDTLSTDITEIDDIEALGERIGNGTLKSEDLVRAYIKRAVIAHQLTNCLTEIVFDESLTRARFLDEYFSKYHKPIGPLHGIPVTLKDQFNVKGVDTTLGYVGRAFNPASEDAVLVMMLKDMGAVVIAKTNLPQSIMWCETENPLWGLTTNPRNKAFTPGGSSGGEGALLALQGSILGWGTDIGGSVRIPSNINGLWGLKPSSGRLPYQGVPVSIEGQDYIPSVIGPMTRSFSSLCYSTKSLILGQPWDFDPKCLPIPWREEVYQEVQSRPLVIGIMTDDNVVKVHPPISRVLREMEDKLRKEGHEIVEWTAEGHEECISIMDQYYTADGGEDIRRDIAVQNEPLLPRVEALINGGNPISVYEYWQLNKLRNAAQKKYFDKWNSFRTSVGRKVDVLLTPTMPHGGVPHRTSKIMNRWVGYTKIWNFLDYTALSFPAGVVSAELDNTIPEYEPRNQLDAWNWKLFDIDSVKGHPVSLQVVGRRLEEEKVLGVAAVLEGLMRK